MKENIQKNQTILAEGHGAQVLKDTMFATLAVSIALNITALVGYLAVAI